MFITFEERAEAIRLNASAMGWDLAAMEKAGTMAIIEARLPGQEIVAGDFDIQGMLAIVGGHIKRIGAKRIVILLPWTCCCGSTTTCIAMQRIARSTTGRSIEG